MTEADELKLAELTADLYLATEEVLNASSTAAKTLLSGDDTISRHRMREVANFVLRDLGRIEEDQDGDFSIAKFVGYICFWYAKIKPLNSVMFLNHSQEGQGAQELLDINEKVALLVAGKIFWNMVRAKPELQPAAWKDCKVETCQTGSRGAKGLCYQNKSSQFLRAHEGKYRKYIEYGLRHRSISPYFLVHYFDSGILFSCEGLCSPISASINTP